MRRPDGPVGGGRVSRPGMRAGSGSATVATGLGLIALVVASVALGVTLLRAASPDAATCRTSAWSALPGEGGLPSGWSVSGTGFFVDSLATTLVGPPPGDGTEAPSVYVSVSCFGNDGHDAMTRSRNAGLAAGGSDLTFPRLGTESYAIRDPSAGTVSVYVLRGGLVANLSSAGSIDPASLELAARAIDGAMSNAQSASGGGPVTPAPAVSAAPGSPSPEPSESARLSHVAPDLEAMLPKTAGNTALTTESITASTAIGDDATAQALAAALQRLGKKPDDLAIAQAYDPATTLDLYIYAFRITGVTSAALAPVITTSWLAPEGSDATSSKVTIAGKSLTKIDFPEAGAADYVYQHGEVVFAVETSDAALATEVVRALP